MRKKSSKYWMYKSSSSRLICSRNRVKLCWIMNLLIKVCLFLNFSFCLILINFNSLLLILLCSISLLMFLLFSNSSLLECLFSSNHFLSHFYLINKLIRLTIKISTSKMLIHFSFRTFRIVNSLIQMCLLDHLCQVSLWIDLHHLLNNNYNLLIFLKLMIY